MCQHTIKFFKCTELKLHTQFTLPELGLTIGYFQDGEKKMSGCLPWPKSGRKWQLGSSPLWRQKCAYVVISAIWLWVASVQCDVISYCDSMLLFLWIFAHFRRAYMYQFSGTAYVSWLRRRIESFFSRLCQPCFRVKWGKLPWPGCDCFCVFGPKSQCDCIRGDSQFQLGCLVHIWVQRMFFKMALLHICTRMCAVQRPAKRVIVLILLCTMGNTLDPSLHLLV